MKTRQMVAVALLAATAVVLQLSHDVIGISSSVTGFMHVDLVAVPVILAFFLFGLEAALEVLIITSIIITIISPTSWIGASMKFASTAPMFLVPAGYAIVAGKKFNWLKLSAIVLFGFVFSLAAFVLSGAINLAGQAFITDSLVLGLLPMIGIALLCSGLFYAWRRVKATSKVFEDPKVMIALTAVAIVVRGLVMIIANYYYAGPLFFKMSPAQVMAFLPWFAIMGWNALQGAVEVAIAWALAYRFKFNKIYGSW